MEQLSDVMAMPTRTGMPEPQSGHFACTRKRRSVEEMPLTNVTPAVPEIEARFPVPAVLEFRCHAG